MENVWSKCGQPHQPAPVECYTVGMNERFTEHGCDWSRLTERERGFCIGYHEVLKRNGLVLEDIHFTNMTPEYRENILGVAKAVLWKWLWFINVRYNTRYSITTSDTLSKVCSLYINVTTSKYTAAISVPTAFCGISLHSMTTEVNNRYMSFGNTIKNYDVNLKRKSTKV